MSRSRAQYDAWLGVLAVPVSKRHMRRAVERLQGQGTSGLARVGARVRKLVRELGGYAKRGRPRGLLTRSLPKK